MHPCTWIDHFGVFFGFPWNRDRVSLRLWFKLQASSYPQSFFFGKVVLLAKSKNILGTANIFFRSVPPELPAALWPQQRRAHRLLHRQEHRQGKKMPNYTQGVLKSLEGGIFSAALQDKRLSQRRVRACVAYQRGGYQATVRGLPVPWSPITIWIQRVECFWCD